MTPVVELDEGAGVRKRIANADEGAQSATAANTTEDHITLSSIFLPSLRNCGHAGNRPHGASMTPPATEVRLAEGVWRGVNTSGRRTYPAGRGGEGTPDRLAARDHCTAPRDSSSASAIARRGSDLHPRPARISPACAGGSDPCGLRGSA